jgi:leader peptidase (prepilin peptidase)/N-methyltransferase
MDGGLGAISITIDPLLSIILFLLGLCIGSFLNVCIHRMPRGESISFPGSRCTNCGTAIRWYDNVPVASYLALGGKCRACKAPVSPRYLYVEVLTGIIFAAHALFFEPGVLLAARLVFSAILIALFFIDLEHQLLPDALTLPGTAIGILASFFAAPGWQASLVGAALGAAILLAIRWLWKRATGVDGMGLGDVKMLAMIGAFLGWQQVWLVLFVASLAGAIAGVAIAAAGRGSMKSKLPFGTFLGVAALFASLWGEGIIAWYVGLITLQ